MAERTELRTERLLLRPFRFGDERDVLAYCVQPGFGRYLPAFPQPYTALDATEFVAQRVLEDWHTRPHFAIVFEERVVGSVNLRVEPEWGRASIGYGIDPSLWGRGITAEAATAAIDWAFSAWSLVRIAATADAGNQQSWRVMEKLGMRREGVLRSHRLTRGVRSDEVVYGLLREEWASRR